MQEVDEFKTYIKPSVFKVLNPKIIDITGITEDHLKDGIKFEDAMDNLKDFIGGKMIYFVHGLLMTLFT